MAVKDWRGNEIKVGSKVVWPGRSGSNMWMTEGEVVEILESFNNYSDPHHAYPIYKLKVMPVGSTGYSVGKKVVTITQYSRVTVLQEIPIMIPFNYPAEPLELPQFPTEANITWTMGSSLEELPPAPTVKESLEAIKILLDKLPTAERKQLTRDLIRKSINLNLKDFKDT